MGGRRARLCEPALALGARPDRRPERFLWTPDVRQTVWGAIARAVRTPSRGRALELSVVGQNLVHDHHREFAGGTEVERSAYAMARWWW